MSNAALVTNTAPTHPIRPATPDDFETVRRHYAMVQDAHAARMRRCSVRCWRRTFRSSSQQLPEGRHTAADRRAGWRSRRVAARDLSRRHRPVRLPAEPRGRDLVCCHRAGAAPPRCRALADRAAAEWAADKQADRIDLSVWALNTEALELYRKLGFAHARTGMMIRPSDALACWGRGRLPRPRPPGLAGAALTFGSVPTASSSK